MIITKSEYIAPIRMAKLASKVNTSLQTIQSKLPSQYQPAKPPRCVSEITALILSNKASEIKPLEWTLLLNDKHIWSSKDAIEISMHVCKSLKCNLTLNTLVFNRFLNSITQQPHGLPIVLFKALSAKKSVGMKKQPWEFLHTLNSETACARHCMLEILDRNPKQPHRLQNILASHVIPYSHATLYHLAKHLPQAVLQHKGFKIGQANRDYILRRVLDAMTELKSEQQFDFIELFISDIQKQKTRDIFQPFIIWVNDKFGPQSNPVKWRMFQPKTRETISNMMGMTTYKKLTSAIDRIAESPLLDEKEKQLLRKRKLFWQHYQQYFLSIRILAPESTLSTLENDSIIKEHVSFLLDDSSPETEICIFELEKYIIVEFMRNRGGEGRIFAINEETKKLLLKANIGAATIRRLDCLKIYDHCFLWQNYLVKTLASLGLLPQATTHYNKSKNIISINTITKSHAQFDLEKGQFINQPSQKDINERAPQVIHWKRRLEQL